MRGKLSRMGYVLRKGENNWVRRVMDINVTRSNVEEDTCSRWFVMEVATYARKWPRLSLGS